jgi:hypothetical protein
MNILRSERLAIIGMANIGPLLLERLGLAGIP